MGKKRTSPAIVVAALALVAALAGTALAGGDATTSAISKKKVKKIARKQAVKQINALAPELSVANADTVGGRPASAFATRASEPYRRVGTPGQPQFQNGWGNQSPATGAAFYKDSQGVVRLKGIVTGGAAGDDVFTLPTGYRPAAGLLLPVAVDGAVAGNVEIDSDGTLEPLSSDPTPIISFDGITFRAGS